MKELTLLDFDSLPDLFADVLCAEILNLDKKQDFEYDNCHEFVITLSDNVVLETFSNEMFDSRKACPAYTFFQIRKNHKYILYSKDGGRIIHLKTHIYALNEAKQSPSELNRSYLPIKFQSGITTPDGYNPYFPDMKNSIILLASYLESTDIQPEILRRYIENLLTMLLSIDFSITNKVMHSISGIALTNTLSLDKKPFTLSVSNVYIYSENPESQSGAKLLQTNCAEHKYIEIPRKASEYQYDYCEFSSDINDSVGNFSITDNDLFKLWLFPDSNPLYLSKDQHKAVITLKLKCSQPIEIQLHLYSIPSYYSISYSLSVAKANVWQSFLIPIIDSSTSNTFHPLVIRAIDYIKENYETKLTIESIANVLHIHPSYLSAIFKRSTGQSVNSYINHYRVTVAKQMLVNTDNDISSIANMTGFYDSQHFLKTFKKICGTTPKNFRKNFTAL